MQENIVQFRTKHPIITSIFVGEGLYLITLLLGRLIGLLTPQMWLSSHPYLGQLLADLAGFIVTYSAIYACNIQKLFHPVKHSFLSGIIKPGFWITLLSIISLVNNLKMCLSSKSPVQPPMDWIIFLLSMFAVGLFEETTFRGFALNILLDRFHNSKRVIFLSLILSSILFGCIHFGNLLVGAPLGSVFIQVISASILGIYFGAIYLRSGNLYVVIFLHALFDAAQLMTSGIFTSSTLVGNLSGYGLINLIGLTPFIISIFILLRPSKMNEIIDRLSIAD